MDRTKQPELITFIVFLLSWNAKPDVCVLFAENYFTTYSCQENRHSLWLFFPGMLNLMCTFSLPKTTWRSTAVKKAIQAHLETVPPSVETCANLIEQLPKLPPR